ncbi:phage tail tape measure protein, TP901 family, core region [Hathewaya proteolytica DSM 3090]|uniref:Phage tail tape measure protein, TP901 family, core region n=1 Tax=Hathewaya proteolytica DSM 3090 TaxID=1121331 RepID=A0A1M6L0R6_9CLOT|nr:phage tail tape measure protein [Hathewaya proteolytica]SHJ64714.1 phage tail tape measure protein, TP901 family, core region [Hathewaya proteolytica DSM 3090]
MAIMDLGALGLKFLIDKTNWGKGFKEADEDIEKHDSKWKSFASNMSGKIKGACIGAVAGIGTAVGAMALEGAKNLVGLEDNMAKFQSATGMTAEETEKVRKTVMELYKVNEDSYEDIAKTAEALHNNMGMTSADIDKYMQNFMNYAKVTGQANDEAVGAIDDLGDAWGMTTEESVSAMDKLLVLNQDYGMSVQDSQNALTKMAPALQSANMSFDEGTAYMAMFAQTGIDASTASTAFTKALQKVKSPDELQKLIKDIQDTKDPMEASAKASELFGSKAGVQMAQALRESDVDIQKFTKSMNETTGAVDKASDAYDGSLKTQLSLMKKQLQGLFTDLGEKLMPVIKSVVTWTQQHMPQIQAVFSTVFTFVGDILGKAIDVIGKVIKSIQEFYIKNKATFDKVGDIFKLLYKNIKEIMDKVWGIISKIWKMISDFMDKHGTKIMKIVSTAFDFIKKYIGDVMEVIKAIIDTVMAILSGDWDKAWDGVKKIVSKVWDTIKDLIKGALKLIGDIIAGVGSMLWDVAKTAFNKIWDAIKWVFEQLLDWLKEIISVPVDIITGIGSSLYDAGKAIFTSLWDGIKDIWKNIKKWVQDKVDWLVSKLKFWEDGNKKMDKDDGKDDGSHYNGLNYVPYDGYKARLHKGEMVLKEDEAVVYRNGQGGKGGFTQNVTINSPKALSPSEIARQNKYALQQFATQF